MGFHTIRQGGQSAEKPLRNLTEKPGYNRENRCLTQKLVFVSLKY